MEPSGEFCLLRRSSHRYEIIRILVLSVAPRLPAAKTPSTRTVASVRRHERVAATIMMVMEMMMMMMMMGGGPTDRLQAVAS